MEIDIFPYDDYKTYLNDCLDNPSLGGRGARARLAGAIGCQTSYMAQVLRGAAHFSMEQAEATNAFLRHTEEQGNYLILLVLSNRTNSKSLRQRLLKQMRAIRENRRILKIRLGVAQPLTLENQLRYYSSWHFSAIHALAAIPGLRSTDAIVKKLGFSPDKVNQAVEFLISAGLLTQGKNGLDIGEARLHLGSDSPLIGKHHINWRLEAIRSIESGKSTDEALHYSSVISISKADAQAVRELFVKAIESAKGIVRKSPSEKAQGLSVDLFDL